MMGWVAWIAVAIVILIAFLLLSVVLSHFQSMGWGLIRPIWKVRRGVRRLIRLDFPDAHISSMGMSSIDPQYFCVLINVKTDSEKGQLLQDKELDNKIRQIALNAGYPAESVPLISFSIESQQTVDRDFNGNWFYARK
jgi:hypothetical protein